MGECPRLHPLQASCSQPQEHFFERSNHEGRETMVKLSGANALIGALKKQKVKDIFGIPGGVTLPLYDALVDSDLRHILAHHEQCAAHMADGYARASGFPGVCLATSGPGATNLVTGIATAYMDSSPIIALTGQVPRMMIGRDAFQEADIIGITTPITKYGFQAKNAAEIPSIVKKAFFIAPTGRPGPVLIDLPRDVLQEMADVDFDAPAEVRGYKPRYDPHPIQVKKGTDMLLSAERPMMLVGGGAISSKASPEVLQLAEHLLMPVGNTLMGKGVIPDTHPLSLGMVGMHGTIEANKLILEADVPPAVGAS